MPISIFSGSRLARVFTLAFLLLAGCGEPTVQRERLRQQDGVSYLGKTPFTGVTVTRNVQGVVIERLTWQSGKPDGRFIRFYANGRKRETGAYLDGKREGPFIRYWQNGEVWGKGSWKAGRRHGPFEEFFDNGQLDERGTYVEGVVDGPYEQFARDGSLLRRGRYVEGSFVAEGEDADDVVE